MRKALVLAIPMLELTLPLVAQEPGDARLPQGTARSEFTPLAPPDIANLPTPLIEFPCTENNQYGIAAGIPNIYRERGYGLEVPVPTR